jgi:hypothetical protein
MSSNGTLSHESCGLQLESAHPFEFSFFVEWLSLIACLGKQISNTFSSSCQT